MQLQVIVIALVLSTLSGILSFNLKSTATRKSPFPRLLMQIERNKRIIRSNIAFGINDAGKRMRKKGKNEAPILIDDSQDERNITIPINGEIIDVRDYSLRWVDSSLSQSSTHEITFNPLANEHIWITGMMDNQIAKVDVNNPRRPYQIILTFAEEGAQPHTLRFDKQGFLWVGLEYTGQIVKLDPSRFTGPDKQYDITEADYLKTLDVRIAANGDSIPFPINTHPHGWCFDRTEENIWFTGKLTNTVGRINIESGKVQHFQLPTLGAVPIYLSLGPDSNVWGTCLANNNIFRVTTGENPIVTEIPITQEFSNSRPIGIKPGFGGSRYMWFSNELGHSVARVDVDRVNKYVEEVQMLSMKEEKISQVMPATCTCSTYFYEPNGELDLVEIFPVPMMQRNMLLADLAFDAEGNLWTQSYVDHNNPLPEGADYIVKIGKEILEAVLNKNTGKILSTGIPIKFYEIPTNQTILHRIILGPDKKKLWFTELGADRLGVVNIEREKKAVKTKNDNPLGKSISSFISNIMGE